MKLNMNFSALTSLIGLSLFFDSCGSNQKKNTDNKSTDSFLRWINYEVRLQTLCFIIVLTENEL